MEPQKVLMGLEFIHEMRNIIRVDNYKTMTHT